MNLEATPIPGAFLIHQVRREDERGTFERLWCAREFAESGLAPQLAQSSLSINYLKGTLRGLHYQRSPLAEEKLVTCIRGCIFDVMVDIRRGSPSFGRWYGTELKADRPSSLYIPKGLAHGFITLEPDTAILYQISQFHDRNFAAGILWNDPELAIEWPIRPVVISENDRALPPLKALEDKD